MSHSPTPFTRRNFLRFTTGAGLAVGLNKLVPAYARSQPAPSHSNHHNSHSDKYPELIDLVIAETELSIDGRSATALTINDSVPGPLIRWREGQMATIRVTNRLPNPTSIHWHGILLPFQMDGVPGVSFAGIKPGETFTYRFPITQSGTYWYHSHSGLQEQQGHYGAIIVDPAEPDPIAYDREYAIVLSDWTFENPHQVLANLKKMSTYYNFQQLTAGEKFKNLDWSRMRMDPTDIADVTGATYTYLMNGIAPASNWTGIFQPGERVRLRFINAAAMTFFDVRIPGLKMTVVQADGQNVQPVTVDEFRIAVAETYDVIVQPEEDAAYTIFAETMDRSGYARGTLAPRPGMTASLPERRQRPLRTMADMGMMHDMSDHAGHGMSESPMPESSPMPSHDGHSMPSHENHNMSGHEGHQMPNQNGHNMTGHNMTGHEGHAMPNQNGHNMTGHEGHNMTPNVGSARTMPEMDGVMHGPDDHGSGSAGVAMMSRSRMHEPGIGLESTPDHRVLVYTDLRSLTPQVDQRPPDREIELHLTGNMERYMWSFDGKKFSQAKEPIHFRHGERLRLTMVNDTMMEHPIHLHGMWMELVNGASPHQPRKHTIDVKPAERLSVDITVDAPGDWAFHCHLIYHMKAGMFRIVSVTDRIPEVG